MTTMKKLLAVLLALAGAGLAGMPVAAADESGFIEAIDAVGHYSTVYPDETVQVGYRVCAAFDRGGDAAAVQEVLKALQPGRFIQPRVLRHPLRAVGCL